MFDGLSDEILKIKLQAGIKKSLSHAIKLYLIKMQCAKQPKISILSN